MARPKRPTHVTLVYEFLSSRIPQMPIHCINARVTW
jgi:hypothetical protein